MKRLNVFSIGLISLVVFSVFAMSMLGQVHAADTPELDKTATGEQYEHFIDLLGNVNYTVDPTGATYEGQPLNSLTSNSEIKGSIEFAISIGANYVFYYTMPDGSIPQTIEDLYAPGVLTHVLYDAEWSTPTESFGGLSLSSLSTDNLTVDTLDQGETEDSFALSDLINGTANSFATSTLIGGNADPDYLPVEKDILNFGASDLLYDAPDPDLQPVSEIIGTENMTQTVYTWLARYIEDTESSIDSYTVSIDDSTETINSESITVMLNDKAQESVMKIVDEELNKVGYGGLSFPALGKKIGASLTKYKGSFSFASGMSVANLAKKSYATAKRAVSTTLGSKTAQTIIKAAIATNPITLAYTSGSAIAKYGSKFVSKASSKMQGFAATIGKKLKSTPFGFVGGIIKKVAQVGSFIMRYWYIWLILAGIAFLMFNPVTGPFLMQNTIRKVIK